MSRLLSFTMSIFILMQSTNIGLDELSKFDALVEHAQFHQEQYGDSFFEFLAEHYGNKTHSHNDNGKKHENLPFKHQDFSHVTTFLAQNLEFNFKKNPEDYHQKPIFFYKEIFSFFDKSSIFQPPKSA